MSAAACRAPRSRIQPAQYSSFRAGRGAKPPPRSPSGLPAAERPSRVIRSSRTPGPDLSLHPDHLTARRPRPRWSASRLPVQILSPVAGGRPSIQPVRRDGRSGGCARGDQHRPLVHSHCQDRQRPLPEPPVRRLRMHTPSTRPLSQIYITSIQNRTRIRSVFTAISATVQTLHGRLPRHVSAIPGNCRPGVARSPRRP